MLKEQPRIAGSQVQRETVGIESETARAKAMFLERAEQISGILRIVYRDGSEDTPQTIRVYVGSRKSEAGSVIRALEAEMLTAYPDARVDVWLLEDRQEGAGVTADCNQGAA
jgi:hypothetical protein